MFKQSLKYCSRVWKPCRYVLRSRNLHAQTFSPLTPINALTLRSSEEAPHVKGIHMRLISHGIVRIGLGFPDDESQYLQRLICRLHESHGHGLPIDHSASRGCLWDVRPTSPAPIPSSTRSSTVQARSETMENFPWHTDCSYESSPPQYFGLQVLQPDRCKGGTLSLLNTTTLLKRLPHQTLRALSQPDFRINVPPEFLKNTNKTYIISSLVNLDNTNYPSMAGAQIRFREDIIDPLTEDARKALEQVGKVLRGSELQDEILHLTAEQLPQGSIILIDNRRWLHARSVVKDPDRHLRRVRWHAIPFARDASHHLC